MKIGNKEFQTENHTYLMGILNVTPDSFSDGGMHQDLEAALRQAERMLEEGADIIDVGGESTRPGYIQISEKEEAERILPVIEAVKKRFDVPVSVDTYKSRVAAEAVKAGADLINDIWGLKYDNKMAEVIAKTGCACCLMHNRNHMEYENFMQDMLGDLKETLQLAQDAGIKKDRIILDPGIGFAKSYEKNLEAIRNFELLHQLGCPLLLGASRKSVAGIALQLPVTERLEGTLAATVFAVQKGAMFVRVHDVKENARVIKMTEAILGRSLSWTK